MASVFELCYVQIQINDISPTIYINLENIVTSITQVVNHPSRVTFKEKTGRQ